MDNKTDMHDGNTIWLNALNIAITLKDIYTIS